jgi:hypothetical protein
VIFGPQAQAFKKYYKAIIPTCKVRDNMKIFVTGEMVLLYFYPFACLYFSEHGMATSLVTPQ